MRVIKKALPEKFAIACSGGTDSVALSYFLRKHSPTLIHFNHKVLPESELFAKNAQALAEKLNLPFIYGEAKESYSSGSIEAWCRKQRYDWFSTLKLNILTAHTLNDCVESYLMRVFQGQPHYAPIPIKTQFGESTVIRPMMLTTKEQVTEFLIKNNLEAIIDPSNKDSKMLRNWIRLDLLPFISNRKEINLLTTVGKIVQKQYISA